MSFNQSWYEKLIGGIILVLITAYIIGSIIFFIDMKNFSHNITTDNDNYKKELLKVRKHVQKTDSLNSCKNKALNFRFDMYNDKNSTEHKKIETELKRFEYVMLKGNKKLLKEMKELRLIQESAYLMANKNNK